MRDKLLKLLKKECFISGEQLGKKLNVSRTAVWKQIKALQELGYEINSVKNKGYQLIPKPDIPIPEEITPELNTRIVGKKIFYFNTLPSTNSIAKQKIKENIPEGTVIVADVQTSGKGRKSRTWYSPEGGLWFSVVLYPHIPPQNGMLITMASSVAVAQAIKEITGLNPIVKWPNDLLLNGKKICGILTELDAEMDRINYAVVGIGINVNNPLSKELQKKATSLIKEKDSYVSRVKLLRSILKYLDKNYGKLISREYDSIRELWFSHTNIIGRKIQVQDEKTVIEGVVNDVDISGCLILDTKDGRVRVVSGDLTYL